MKQKQQFTKWQKQQKYIEEAFSILGQSAIEPILPMVPIQGKLLQNQGSLT